MLWIKKVSVNLIFILLLTHAGYLKPCHAQITQIQLKDEEQVFFDGLNRFRNLLGLTSLALDPYLQLAASQHSSYQASRNYLDHEGPTPGSQSWDRAKAAGLKDALVGENIACGNEDGLESLKQLLLSPAHLGTMLDPRYHLTGVARAFTDLGLCHYYWTNDFATQRQTDRMPQIGLIQVIQAIESVCGPLTLEEKTKVQIDR